MNFVIFWHQILWKSRDSGYLVSATPHTILYRSLWNFAHVFAMVWRCARGLDITFELIFVTFSTLWTLSFLTSDSMKVYRQWLSCKHNSLYNFMPVFMQLCTFFFNGLKMCMWFGFNPAINFCHFSTLSDCAGATSTSPKFYLFFSVAIDPILFKLAGNKSMHNILDEFEFRPDLTTDNGVSCPWAS